MKQLGEVLETMHRRSIRRCARTLCCGLAIAISTGASGGVLAVDDTGTARNGKVGHFSSMVASSNELAVTYYCEKDPSGPMATTFQIRFAWKSGDCWQKTNLDVGSYSSLKRDSTGLYHVCYAGWNGLVWGYGYGRNWTFAPERVDSGVAPAQLTMALDAANRPHVAYFDDALAGNHALRYTFWNGTQWMRGSEEIIATNIWTPTSSPDNTFLALDTAGAPHVAFAQPSDSINAMGQIKYASLQGGVWTVESLNAIGINPSLAIGSDNVPRIAFGSPIGVTYAYKTGGQWYLENATFGVPGVSGVSTVELALGPDNSPAISFGMTANEDLYLATRGSTGWSAAIVDGDHLHSYDLILGRLGTGLAIDAAGQPHVSYWAVTIYDVPGGYTDHRSDLRYYTPGSTGTICPEAPGACCDPASAACTLLMPSACTGFWHGAASCSPDPCNPDGACCDPAGACTITLRSDCVLGTWNGAASCQPDPCDPAVACCSPGTQACSVLPLSQCAGSWFSPGSCTPDPCDPLGACCDAATGVCTAATQSGCADTWLGAGPCIPNPCPRPDLSGACCYPDTNTCEIIQQSACTEIWLGFASCLPNPCAGTGACCERAECVVVTLDECSRGGFQGPGTTCGPIDNPTTCCPANFNLTGGVTVQDIFDFLSTYFSANRRADINSSGSVTVQDIFDFLAAYFAGC